MRVDAGLGALETADTVIVPGFFPREDPSPAALGGLQEPAARGARVASVCVGAFALAAAGLRDGRRATTHWEFAEELATRFPGVGVCPEVLIVDDGQILTSAGIAAGIDLCLHMVRADHGAAAAAEVSRRMVAAVHRPGGQAQFMQRPVPETGPGLAPTCAWAIHQMHRPLTVGELADHAGYAPRTFARHFVAETGLTPLRWLPAQRLLEARRLLERRTSPSKTSRSGAASGPRPDLRLHLARDMAIAPSAYRSAFRGVPMHSPAKLSFT